MNIYDQLKQLWARVTELTKNGAAADTKIAALEAAAVRIPKDYSTTETATGQRWIDGNEIYCKVFESSFSDDGTSKVIGNISIANLVNLILIVGVATQRVYTSHQNTVTISSGDISVVPPSSTFNGVPLKCIIYYTKPDPVPATREPDDEPETKATKATKKKASK